MYGSFPGLNAPASLKPCGIRSEPARASTFSGAECPGLIEALVAVHHCLALGKGFPGLNAPASLKQHGLVQRLGAAASFPGLNAPASLKQFPVEILAQALGRFPGLNAPASLKLCRLLPG